MSWLVWPLLLLAFSAALARFELSLRQWLVITGTVLFVTALVGWMGPVSGLLFGGTWLAFALFGNLPELRQRWLSAPALRWLRGHLPPMSDTERTAIEAGTVWWEGQLFAGRPDFRTLLNLPAPHLTEREQAFLDGPVETLARMLDDWRITHELGHLPPEVWDFMKRERMLGMIIPEAYGGLGFSALAHSAVVMKLASRSISAAVSVMVPNSLGPAELLLHYGTEQQKKHYLPRLARGEEIPCFALTGPEAGSDASAIPDYGIVCWGEHEGERVLGLRLNWEKRYITLGPVATLLGLAFRAYDPDHLLGEREDLGITCALIPTDTPGIEIGQRHLPLNAVFQNGPNRGRDVFIPLDWVIGGRERLGDGWRMLMESLSAGRGISLPALATAAGKHAARTTGAYARVRKQFHQPIGRFEGVEEALARIGGLAYAMDAARTLTTTAIDRGERPAVVSAIVKYNLTEMMRVAINDAMDVHGGRAICLGPANYLARTYQSIPISITVEGANILTRSLIIFGQGAIRCHPYLLEEMNAAHAADGANALARFYRALTGHVGHIVTSAARSFAFALTNGDLAPVPAGTPAALHDGMRQLQRFSASFAIAAEVALATLGGSLKRREKLSGRFADVFSQLYIGAALIKRYSDDGLPVEDRPLYEWALAHCLYQAQQALDGIIRHFPVRPLRWLLRLLVFPVGRPRQPPADDLGHRVAALLQLPGETRERLTAGIYRSRDPADPVGRIEHALHLTLHVEPLERRLREQGHHRRYDETWPQWAERLAGEGVVSADEARLLREAHEAIRHAIDVDAFPPDAVTGKADRHETV